MDRTYPTPQPVVVSVRQLREALAAATFATGDPDADGVQVHLSESSESILRIELFDTASGDGLGVFTVDPGEAPGETGRYELVSATHGAPQWCPVCKTYHHPVVGEMTDAGVITRACPRVPTDDPAYFGSPLYTGDRGRS